MLFLDNTARITPTFRNPTPAIVPMVTTPAGDWKQRARVFSGAWVYWHGVINEDAGTAQCYVRYRQPTAAGNAPVVDYVSNGC